MERILILSPHTDDAELGCGGAIVKFLEQKKEIYWMVFSNAQESLPKLNKDTLEIEFKNVIESLGLSKKNYNIYDHKVRLLSENRQKILEEMVYMQKQFKPELVIGPSLKDFHQDHIVVANEMVRAFKKSSSIICYELPWNHIEFQTNMFVALEEHHINGKIDMLKKYVSQVTLKRNYFSKSFIKGLAATRGVQINTAFAEAFEVIRWVI